MLIGKNISPNDDKFLQHINKRFPLALPFFSRRTFWYWGARIFLSAAWLAHFFCLSFSVDSGRIAMSENYQHMIVQPVKCHLHLFNISKRKRKERDGGSNVREETEKYWTASCCYSWRYWILKWTIFRSFLACFESFASSSRHQNVVFTHILIIFAKSLLNDQKRQWNEPTPVGTNSRLPWMIAFDVSMKITLEVPSLSPSVPSGNLWTAVYDNR